MLPLFDREMHLPASIQDALDRGAIVLTASRRAARALELSHADDQRAQGREAWHTPRIHDWAAWREQLWHQHALLSDGTPTLLTPLQEQTLWLRMQYADAARVVAPERMAELAQEAYTLLSGYNAHAHRANAVASLGATHEDAERFFVWAANFDRYCQQNGYLSPCRMEETLARTFVEPAESAQALPVARPSELYLVGFDRITPAQALLLASLTRSGVKVSAHEPQNAATSKQLVRAADLPEEIEACARWCRGLLEQESGQRIGVIVPDLRRVRGPLDRIFRRTLMPQIATSVETGTHMPYEFSLGTPLAEIPVVRAALLLLRWLRTSLPSADATWLLVSGFFAASAADSLAMARLDAQLRASSAHSPHLTLDQVLRERSVPDELRRRLGRLRDFVTRNRLTEQQRSWPQWVELVQSALQEAGWPGYIPADSLQYQARQRWTRVLNEVALLGFEDARVPYSEFMRTLASHAHSVIFAAESQQAPIQVLGAFESSGQSFDAVWFLGVDESHWPAIGRTHPLLPGWLQRETGMPHASVDADWKLAQEATARIASSAPHIVFSYAAQEKSIELRPSPLLAQHFPGATPLAAAEFAVANTARQKDAPSRRAQPPLETVADDSGTLAWPAAQSAGGSEVLKRQAACAFQSFATNRLQARPLEEIDQGLSAAERGTLLHSVLENLYASEPGVPGTIHTLEDLRNAAADGYVTALLTDNITRAFAAETAQHGKDEWMLAYLEGEQERLLDRLGDWLQCELRRQPFTVVAREKKMQNVQVGELLLSLRADRVDQLADGSHLLLDYKTGEVSAAAWDGARPDEPQLPLYALFGGVENVSGVAFAKVRAGKTSLEVRAEEVAAQVSETAKPTIRNRYDDEIRDEWQDALLALAANFMRGEAAVDPKRGQTTCRYCTLSGLCRVQADGPLPEEEEPDEQAEAATRERGAK